MATVTRSVSELADILRREDSSQWDKVDALRYAVDEKVAEDRDEDLAHAVLHTGAHGVNTGLWRYIEKVWMELWEEDDIPEMLSQKTLSRWYVIASAWPGETRVAGASFGAHAELSAAKYRHRQGLLSKLVSRSSRGRVGVDDVRVWKSEQDKKMPDVWAVRFERRLRSQLNSQLIGPHAQSEWETTRDILKGLLKEVNAKLETFDA